MPAKGRTVRQALNRLGGEALKTMDLLPAPETRRYRNKAQYPVAQEKQRAMAGFYREGTHQVVSCPSAASWPRKWMLSGMRWWII